MLPFAISLILCVSAHAVPTVDKSSTDERLKSIERRLDRLEKIR